MVSLLRLRGIRLHGSALECNIRKVQWVNLSSVKHGV